MNNIPAGQSLYVAAYDDVHQVWVKVPILAMDKKNNKVTVQANHFSTWGAGLGSSVPQDGANILTFDGHYTSLFTGTARYSIPIWTPPGRAGLQPSISLSYSSATVDGLLGNVQAPWVGEGWNIDGVEIVRQITTSNTGYGYVDTVGGTQGYSLTINGQMYTLLVDPNQPDRYYPTVEQGDFLYIVRHNDALDDYAHHTSLRPPNETGEWWEVVTKAGQRYRLGWNIDSEQLALMYGYGCSSGTPCTTPDGTYASLGYAGYATDLVASRWRVDQIVDTHQNYLTYTYTKVKPDAAFLPQFDRASYLQSISYVCDNAACAHPGYQVVLQHGDRAGDATPQAYNLWENFDTQQLNEVDVCFGACVFAPAASSTVVRKYVLGYAAENVPDPNGTLTLTSLGISGRTEIGDVANHPYTQAPTISFSYIDHANAISGSAKPFFYPRLLTINNGYGATLTYIYETDRTTNWYDYRVKTATVNNGIQTSGITGYAYGTPVYDPNSNALTGYPSTTEIAYDFNGTTILAQTLHQFGTVGLDTGNELSTSWEDASDLPPNLVPVPMLVLAAEVEIAAKPVVLGAGSRVSCAAEFDCTPFSSAR